MESFLILPFFISTSISPIPSHTGHGKWHGTPTKPNTLPQLTAYPCLVSTYTETLPHEGGTFPNASEMFFEKMKKFSIRKYIRWKKRKNSFRFLQRKIIFSVIFHIFICNTDHSFEIFTNALGAILNKLPFINKNSTYH